MLITNMANGVIALSGIQRAGSDSTCEAGTCNEVIGMEFRDGVYRPYSPVKDEQYYAAGDEAVWVHKTSVQDNYIFLNDGKIYWATWQEGAFTERALLCDIGDSKHIDFVGNVLKLQHSGESFYIFRDKTYKLISIKDIEFGMQLDVFRIGKAIPYFFSNRKLEVAAEYTETAYKKVMAEVKNHGYYSGISFMRYGIELYDGNVINASVPVLVCDSDLRALFGREEKLYKVSRDFAGHMSGITIENGVEGYFDDCDKATRALKKENTWEGMCFKSKEDFSIYNIDRDTNNIYANSKRELYKSIYNMFILCDSKPKGYAACSVMALSLPAYRILKPISQGLETFVRGINIYSTIPVRYFEEIPKQFAKAVNSFSKENIMCYPDTLSKEQVKEELEKSLITFHKIYHIPYNDIKKLSAGDYDFAYTTKNNLSAIENQPILETSSTSDVTYKISKVYNGRLHVGQITSRIKEYDCGESIRQNDMYYKPKADYAYTFQGKKLSRTANIIFESNINKVFNAMPHYGSGFLRSTSINTQSVFYGNGKSYSSFDNLDYVYAYVVTLKDDDYGLCSYYKFHKPLPLLDVDGKKVPLLYQMPCPTSMIYPSDKCQKVEVFIIQNVKGQSYKPSVFTFVSKLETDYILTPQEDNNTSVCLDFEEKTFNSRAFGNYFIGDIVENEDKSIFNYKPAVDFDHHLRTLGYVLYDKDVRENNILKVSEVNNPIYFPDVQTYTVGDGDIIGFSVNTMALSQDQFGQYPLYVFCTDGIYAMELDATGAMAYVRCAPLSREVCCNADTICEVDGATVFGSKRGLMLLESGKVTCLSAMINGLPSVVPPAFRSERFTCEGNGLKVYGNAVSHPQLVQLENALTSDDFIDYLNAAGTHITYLYDRNELLIYNPNVTYVYVVSIGSWHCVKQALCVKFDTNNYPITQFALSDGDTQFYSFPIEGSFASVDTLFQTRPIRLSQVAFGRTLRVVVRGLFHQAVGNEELGERSDKKVGMYVLGSNDCKAWQFMGGKEVSAVNTFVRDIGCSLLHVTCKYLMVVFVGNLLPDSEVNYIQISTGKKYGGKVR